MGDITWKNDQRKLGDLIPWDKNPREITKSQAGRLLESWDEFGQVEPIAIGPENELYNGHQRLKVLMAKHGPAFTVNVVVSSRKLTEKQREKLTIFLHTGAAGQYDWDALANNFDIVDLLNWGFTEKQLLSYGMEIDKAMGDDAGPQIERKEELQEMYGVKVGQVWQLGDHRIACGDCTDPAINALLFQGEKAEMCWTDPPWNVAYGTNLNKNPQHYKIREIQNDNLGEKFGAFAEKFCRQIRAQLVPGGILYMAMSAQEWGLISATLNNSGFHWSSTIIWSKDQPVLSRKDYHTQYEPLWFGTRSGSSFLGRIEFPLCCLVQPDDTDILNPNFASQYDPLWYGWHDGGPRVHRLDNRKQTDVWEIDRPKKSEEHPTMKPLELVERSLRNSSRAGFIIGSGTTLIACQRLQRRCRAVELDPGYVAVSIQRWVDMCDGEPLLVQNGGDEGKEEE